MAEGKSKESVDCSTGVFTCIICGKGGLDEENMKFHVMVEHIEETVCCPFCDLNCMSTEKLNKHVNDEHMDYLSPMRENSEDFPGRKEDNQPIPPDVLWEKSSPELQGESGVIISIGNVDGEQKHPEQIEKINNINNEQSEIVSRDKENWTEASRSKLFLNVPLLFSQGKKKLAIFSGKNKSGENGDIDMEINVENSKEDKVSLNAEYACVQGEAPMEHSFSCPLCSFSTDSEACIQQHVNKEHSDILSPMKTGDQNMEEDDFEVMYSCPICAMSLDTPRSLEIHVNSKHTDILSPGKVLPKAAGTLSKYASPSEGEALGCPVCEKEFPDPMSLSAHVDGHFSAGQTPVLEMSDQLLAEELQRSETEAVNKEQKEFKTLQAIYGMDGKTSYKQQYEKSLEKAVWNGDLSISEFYQQKTNFQSNDLSGVDDGHSCTKGIIPHLQKYYKASTGYVYQSWLCTTVDHFAASYGDKGWGCGYRNFQMLLSSLTAESNYCKVLFNGRPLIPSIPKIQRLIETAWQKGFDKQGCEQLGGRVVNSRKWIGATEIVSTLSSLKIRCQLLDFHSPSGPGGTHPKLFQWVKDYFDGPGPFKPPLFLQHQGHSRTIIGIEELGDKSWRLLIFDPSTAKKQMQQFLGPVTGNLLRTIRRAVSGLKAKQYQLVAVNGILGDKEYEESKVMRSDRIS